MESIFDWEEAERTVFDMDDFTIDLAVEEAAENECLSEEEVREKYSESYLMEYAVDLEDHEREHEIFALREWFDFSCGGVRNNPNAGNYVLVRGYVDSWETGSSTFIFPNLGTILGWVTNSKLNLVDFEATRIFDVNGALHLQGIQHGGDVELEVRQLTNKASLLLDEIACWDELCIPEEGIEAMGKVYAEGMEDELIADLWDDPELCPVPRYMERFYGAAALHFWSNDSDDGTIDLTVHPEPREDLGLKLVFGTGTRELPAPLAEKLEGHSRFKDFDDAVEQCRLVYGAACDRG